MSYYTTSNGIIPTTNVSQSPYVTLISSDGFEFHIRRSAACVSGTIRRMLEGEQAIHPYHQFVCLSLLT